MQNGHYEVIQKTLFHSMLAAYNDTLYSNSNAFSKIFSFFPVVNFLSFIFIWYHDYIEKLYEYS